jgi:hypothetical protein
MLFNTFQQWNIAVGSKMAAAGKAGTFSSWMLEESDLIQHAARWLLQHIFKKP